MGSLNWVLLVFGGFFWAGFFMPTLVPGVGSAPILLLGSKILGLKEQIRRILSQDQIKQSFKSQTSMTA